MNYLSMYDEVLLFTGTYKTITDSVIGFKNSIDAVALKTTAIKAVAAAQSQNITGVATDKSELKQALANITYQIVSPVKGYAVTIGNATLEEQMAYSQTSLSKMPDQELIVTAQGLVPLVTAIGAPLTDFGITPAIITAWEEAITDFNDALATPRQAIVHRSTLTEQLANLFKETTDILNNVSDAVAVVFRESNPHYYRDYINARKILDLGSGTTRLKGVVTDAATEQPLLGATLTLVELGVTTETDLNGNYLFAPVPRGTYTLRAEAEGYTTQLSPPFELLQGTTVVTNFELEGE